MVLVYYNNNDIKYVLTIRYQKVAAIRELHKIKRQNPNLDINLYLHKISSAFRRFVLDTLSKLDVEYQQQQQQQLTLRLPTDNSTSMDENENINLSNNSTVETFSDIHNRGMMKMSDSSDALNKQLPDSTQSLLKSRSGKLNISSPSGSGISSSENADFSSVRGTSSKASEAMRILEGLKSRPNSYRFPSTPGALSSSDDPNAPGKLTNPQNICLIVLPFPQIVQFLFLFFSISGKKKMYCIIEF